VAIDHDGFADGDALIRDADAAMYEAKRRGRNRAAAFDGDLRRRVTSRLQLEGELREALGTGQFDVWFQPVVDATTLAVQGAEALVRWRHPERGLIMPDDFIPLAEETGLVVPLGYEVLDRALTAASELSERFPELAGIDVGVNLSGRQFGDPECADRLLELIARSPIPVERVMLELTESVLLDHLDEVDTSLHRLSDAGAVLALDDFGCGYCSLSYLRRYPVQVLKLDTSYTQQLGVDEETTVIAEAIATMARRLGLRMVAEGVETAEQLARVRALRIPSAQGLLLGAPVPVEEFRPT
jgi:EAL domain-containing protein (putative c-di-GMP-specific phosphodiesterase class I)